jgi:hypothetical protein
LIEDPSGNTFSMDGKVISLLLGTKKHDFEVGEDLIINVVGKNMTTHVGR